MIRNILLVVLVAAGCFACRALALAWGADSSGAATITRVALDGQDTADLLGLHAWKFQVSPPEGTGNLCIWTEEWTKGNPAPVINTFDLTTVRGWLPEGQLLVSIPSEASPRYWARMGGTSSWSNATVPEILKSSSGSDVLKRQSITLGQPVTLAAFVRNENHVVENGMTDVGNDGLRDNDHILFVKCRFGSESDVAPPVWKDGKIQFQEFRK